VHPAVNFLSFRGVDTVFFHGLSSSKVMQNPSTSITTFTHGRGKICLIGQITVFWNRQVSQVLVGAVIVSVLSIIL
jgi:hypothetical protein